MSSRHSRHSHRGYNSSGRSSRSSTTQQSTTQLILSLTTHRINTLTELRRIELVAASPSTSPTSQLAFQTPMTTAWTYYVTSHQLLTELRGLTRDYPFSSACLDDAKWRVGNDPESNRSWNFAWLVLVKMRNDKMIDTYATSEAALPGMWGGRTPDENETRELAACFSYEWNAALEQMLRHWTTPPTTTGS